MSDDKCPKCDRLPVTACIAARCREMNAEDAGEWCWANWETSDVHQHDLWWAAALEAAEARATRAEAERDEAHKRVEVEQQANRELVAVIDEAQEAEDGAKASRESWRQRATQAERERDEARFHVLSLEAGMATIVKERDAAREALAIREEQRADLLRDRADDALKLERMTEALRLALAILREDHFECSPECEGRIAFEAVSRVLP